MSTPALAALALVLAYVAGSLPASYLAGRLLRGIDLRRHGSGNLGATNVYRTLGAGPAAAVMLVDVAKGYAAAGLLPGLVPAVDAVGEASIARGTLAVACGTAAILGHVFPLWLGFQGGKGVATGVGAFLALSPAATLVAVLVWASVVGTTRIVSLGSLALGLCLPFFVLVEQRGNAGAGTRVAFAAAAGLFLFWTHRENLRRLARGKERRIDRSRGEVR
ncbi:MAG: glycerol-3-phosphate 1-O-acyltransferase PlsY [Gemmatimonadota bacterium]